MQYPYSNNWSPRQSGFRTAPMRRLGLGGMQIPGNGQPSPAMQMGARLGSDVGEMMQPPVMPQAPMGIGGFMPPPMQPQAPPGTGGFMPMPMPQDRPAPSMLPPSMQQVPGGAAGFMPPQANPQPPIMNGLMPGQALNQPQVMNTPAPDLRNLKLRMPGARY